MPNSSNSNEKLEQQKIRRSLWFAELLKRIQGDRSKEDFGKIFGITGTGMSDRLKGKVDPQNLGTDQWDILVAVSGVSYEDLRRQMKEFAEMPEVSFSRSDSEEIKVLNAYRVLPASKKQRINVSLLRLMVESQSHPFSENEIPTEERHSVIGEAIEEAFQLLGDDKPIEISGLSRENLHTLKRQRIVPTDRELEGLAKLLQASKKNPGWTKEIIQDIYESESKGKGCQSKNGMINN